jgi:hypothetical protein
MFKNIILTTYFVTKEDPQSKKSSDKRYIKKDNYSLIKDWVESIERLNLRGIIFCDYEFNLKLPRQVQVINYKLKTNWSVNDERFLCYLEYLSKNYYDNIFLTDLFDIEFFKNPFNLISDVYELYIGMNKGILIKENEYLYDRILKYLDNFEYFNKLDLNAGIIGGNNSNIKKLLNYMVLMFKFYNSDKNINMPVFNKCVYDIFNDILVGHPVSSRFKGYEKDGEFYIRHK